jgi:hypothetical protein
MEKLPLSAINIYRGTQYIIINVYVGEVVGVYKEEKTAANHLEALKRLTLHKYAMYKAELLEYQK